MNHEDEPAYWCARCYAHLPLGNSCHEECPRCDAPINDASAYLTREQLSARKSEDDKRWSEAEQSGLISPKGPGECGGVWL